jgi:hypothetical protein
MVDLDNIEDWAPTFTAAQENNVPEAMSARMVEESPRLPDDAVGKLFGLTDRKALTAATVSWIRSTTIAAYHGTRLTDAEATSVLASGLIPLKATARRVRLERALSRHPRWPDVSELLDPAIAACAKGREGRVTLAFSRSALTNDYNHYLTHGSEFDQCVAEHLLGKEGVHLLSTDGNRTLIQVEVPGSTALKAANPSWSAEEILAREEVPQLAREFLEAWSYWLAHPDRKPKSLGISCDMALNYAVRASWILSIDTLTG